MRARRRVLAAAALLVALPVVILLVAVITIAVFGVSIDASRWRDLLAGRASVALGRPVVLDGAIEIELGRETGLHVASVRILNTPGFAAPELATLGKVRARFDLLAALGGRLQLRSIEAADGRVRLERAEDGRTSWASTASRPGRSEASPLEIEIERLSIRDFAFEYHDQRSGAHQSLDLDELEGVGKWSEPLELTLSGRVGSGRVGGDFPYLLRIQGASAQLLQEGAGPWPFKLESQLLGARLQASGTLDPAHGALQLEFSAAAEGLDEVARFLRAAWPPLGAAALAGKLRVDAAAVEVTDLRGTLGASELAGGLVLALGGPRRRVTGELTITTVDLRPWLDAAPRAAPLTYDDLVANTLPLRGAVPLDADVVLNVGRWLGSAVEVGTTRIALQADARGVRAPIAGTIAGVPLTGRIDFDTGSAIPALALELSARGVPLRGFAQRLTGTRSFDGRLGSFALALGGRGETLGALIADLELRLTAAAARLRYAAPARPQAVEVGLDTIEVVVPRGRPVRATLRGALQGERATLALRAATLPHLLREPTTPIAFELDATGVTARAEGRLAWSAAAGSTEVGFSLDARHAGSLARWLGVAPESKLPLSVRGRLHLLGAQWRVEDTTVQLGRSSMTVDAKRTLSAGQPLITASLRSTLIDLPELKTLRRTASTARPRTLPALLDAIRLPQGVELPAADIGVGVKRVVLGRAELVDASFSTRIRAGRMAPSAFAARFAEVPFQGRLGIDLRSAVPEVSLEMAAGKVNVGELLRRLGVAEAIDARTEALEVKLVGRGRDLDELLERSSLEARLRGGALAVRGYAGKPVAEIEIDHAQAAALPGQPVGLSVQGRLAQTPVEVAVTSATLKELARKRARVPFSVQAKAAGTQLSLVGQVDLPLGRGADLDLALGGEQLDSLSGLTGASLPAWRGWSVQGPLRMTPSGYEVVKLTLRAGQSRLDGRGRLDLAGARPRLDLYLSAPEVQLDDFPATARAARAPARAEALRATAGRAAAHTQELLSAAFLRRFDAYVDVTVANVRSGSDRLGSGMLRLELVDGRLDISPAEVHLPGGSARLSLFYDPTGPEVALAASAYVERFDYGILVRRRRPGADLSGLLSLRMEIAGRAPALNRIMAHANGHIDVAVWPYNLRGGIIDRWTVNVLFALLPVIDPRPQAHVNCVVARMDLKDGLLTQDALLIDTTRVRVFGVGSADFGTEEIAFRFRPRAKDVVLFSLQPPIDVTGTMTSFRVGIPPGSTVDTAARFLTSVFVVPIQMLTRGPLPRDGADVCTDPLR